MHRTMHFTPIQGVDKVAKVGFVAGTIAKDKLLAFERLLFRATRGNVFLKHSEVGRLKDPATGEDVEKSVFAVFFAGERAQIKINKVSG
jgi:V-type H+-transporting ATPase subunit a